MRLAAICRASIHKAGVIGCTRNNLHLRSQDIPPKTRKLITRYLQRAGVIAIEKRRTKLADGALSYKPVTIYRMDGAFAQEQIAEGHA